MSRASRSQPGGVGPSDQTAGLNAESSAARTIHVVIGTTGEYSDRAEWLTRAFESRAEAEAYVALLTAKRQALPARAGGILDWSDRMDLQNAMRAFDPGYLEDYTGTSWYVEAVALETPPLADAAAQRRAADAPRDE
jgi:hypothetical protein